MKKFFEDSLAVMWTFSIIVIAIGLALAVILGKHQKKEYPQSMIVVQIDEATDTVTCEDVTGNLWQFKGIEDWCVDDIAAMIMNDNGTAEISDDEIISVRYCGSCSDG